ncbi:SDR family NAD(P)-dependent oxidoreductase [Thiocystis violacea]|uniref:SDR family NAD(P)-dependent oxidoreductase n=1 Tax=Thiocystis violacea TaxID=13725 RepID=UPI0019067418|nr:short-chain dehydrogenase [Thiocystis violacea]
MSEPPVAVVTGANRGLGLETSRQLAALGYLVLLTARREPDGRAAAEALTTQGGSIRFHPLDITDEASVRALAETVRGIGRLDVLVNNAGIFGDPAPGTPEASVFRTDLARVRESFETNTLGPLRLCQALIPLMAGRGRVVNVSSGMGQLAEMNGGCPGYRLSKVSLNALTRILADELNGTTVKVNSVCPGWVRTDMGGPNAYLAVEEGARGIVWAATLPDDGPSGGFFRQGEPIAW